MGPAMNLRRIFLRYGGLLPVLALYFLLITTYSATIPFSKGPDEFINYQYILFIARHHRLPATVDERREAGVKADWQPLYHLAGGAAAASIPTGPPPELKVTWQPATRRLIDIVLPRATLVNTWDEQPPWRGVYAVWQTGRWVSLWLGAGTVLLTYLLTLRVWPASPLAATAAAALLAFTPRFLFTHAVLSDDTMLAFWLAVYLLLLVRGLQLPSGRLRLALCFAGAGAAAGLAIVTKYAAAPAVAGGLFTLALLARQRAWRWPRTAATGGAFLAGVAVASGWWIGWVWLNFNRVAEEGVILGLLRPLLPGFSVDDNPTTARLTAFLSGDSGAALGDAPLGGGSYLDWAVHSFQTFWGVSVFGAEPRWPYPYGLLLILAGLFCLAALVGLWRRVYRPAPPDERVVWQVLLIHTLLFLPIPLLRFTLSGRLNDAAQGRHLLFPAGPAIAVLLIAGWMSWFKLKWRGWAALGAGAAMLLWGLAHLAYLNWAYPPPLPVRTTPGPQTDVAHPLAVDFGDALRLTGYQVEPSPAGDVLQLDLRWQTLAPPPADFLTEVMLRDSTGAERLRWLGQPADGRFPTRAWQPGDTVLDTLRIPLAGLPPDNYQLQLRLRDAGKPVRLAEVALNPPPADTLTLWQQEQAANKNAALFRYRSTIAVTAPSQIGVEIAGPDGRIFSPAAQTGALHLFLVDHTWPSGDYRLVADGTPQVSLAVQNFDSRRHDGWNFDLPEAANPVNANFNGDLLLLGYDLPVRRVQPGGGVPLVLYWQSLRQVPASYVIFDRLLDAGQQAWGGYDRLPAETYPTNLWVSGEVVADGFAVPVDAAAPDGVYRIVIGLYDEADPAARSLPLLNPETGQPTGQTSIAIGPIKVGGPPPELLAGAEPQTAVSVVFGEQIELLGFDFECANGACANVRTPNGESPSNSTNSITNEQLPMNNEQNSNSPNSPNSINLKLFWQAARPPDADYTLFIHVRDAAGNVVAQNDRPLTGGVYPSSLWEPGERLQDSVSVPLPENLPPGRYVVVAGLYDFSTGQRLVVPGSADNGLQLVELKIE